MLNAMMTIRLRRLVLALAVAFLGTLPMAACNTMEGLGQDMQSAGGNLEEEAEEAAD